MSTRTQGALPAVVVGVDQKPVSEETMSRPSAEVDASGRQYLASEKWQKMGAPGQEEKQGLLDRVFTGLYGNLPSEDRLRVAWLAGTLFFIIGG